MNQIKFNNELISITYNSPEEAEHAKWIFYNHELDKVEVEDNILTFHYKGLRFLGCIIEDIIRKTFKNVKKESWTTEKVNANGNYYLSQHFEAIVNNNNLFKVTVINSNGTKGTSDFGIWQYGRILTLNNLCGDLRISLRNSNLDPFRHELSFDDNLTVYIDIGEIQSQ